MADSPNLDLPDFTDGQANPDTRLNEWKEVFDARQGVVRINMTSDADLNITATGSSPQQWQYGGFEITATGVTLTTGRNVILPSAGGDFRPLAYSLYNNTGDGQALTLKTATGSGIAVADGSAARIQIDADFNAYRVSADATATS